MLENEKELKDFFPFSIHLCASSVIVSVRSFAMLVAAFTSNLLIAMKPPIPLDGANAVKQKTP